MKYYGILAIQSLTLVVILLRWCIPSILHVHLLNSIKIIIQSNRLLWIIRRVCGQPGAIFNSRQEGIDTLVHFNATMKIYSPQNYYPGGGYFEGLPSAESALFTQLYGDPL